MQPIETCFVSQSLMEIVRSLCFSEHLFLAREWLKSWWANDDDEKRNEQVMKQMSNASPFELVSGIYMHTCIYQSSLAVYLYFSACLFLPHSLSLFYAHTFVRRCSTVRENSAWAFMHASHQRAQSDRGYDEQWTLNGDTLIDWVWWAMNASHDWTRNENKSKYENTRHELSPSFSSPFFLLEILDRRGKAFAEYFRDHISLDYLH